MVLCSKHNIDVRTWRHDDSCDSHGHKFYCFSCEGQGYIKDHRSFDSFCALVSHLKDKHMLDCRIGEEPAKDEEF